MYLNVCAHASSTGLADEFIVPHDANRSPANHVMDPFPDVIMGGSTGMIYTNTYIYLRIHLAYTYRSYLHIRTDTCTYVHCM